jgi:Zn-dependent protease
VELLDLVLIALPILLFSVIVHECAHGLVALWHGDTTARDAGRLTLNPLPHLDLYGSIILPAILLVSRTGMLFGWARPVPVNVANLRHPRNDSLKVAAAGPLSNLCLGFAFALVLSAGVRLLDPVPRPFIDVCLWGLRLNCVLAVFNLLPVPPLDGHWLALRLLPLEAAIAYRRIGSLGVVVILLLFLVPGVNRVLVQTPVRFLMTGCLRLAGVPLE